MLVLFIGFYFIDDGERGHRGQGPSRGGNRPPRGLRGRDIGMFYARRGQARKKEEEQNQVHN